MSQRAPIDDPLTILRRAQPALAALCRRYGVRELAVFGSALRPDFRAESDLDILVDFAPMAKPTFVTPSWLEAELQALVGRPVDLVPKRGLHPAIQQDVLNSSRVVYAET